jgi:hypothetical protein
VPEKLAGRLAELRLRLRDANLLELAARSGAEPGPGSGTLRLSLFSRPIIVSFPDLVPADEQTGAPLSDANQTLILYYLSSADGTPVEGRWLSFADLPGGRFYNQAFQGYSGAELAKHFANETAAFERAGQSLAGMRLAFGDASFAFHILPRVMLAAVYHLGDEDFPPSCKILFDATSTHYLPIDACAILGSMLTGKLIAADKK